MSQKLVAILRVKNGAVFIREWLDRMESLVDEIVAVDNGTVDGTLETVQASPKVVALARTQGFHAGRDMNLLYDPAKARKPDWLVALDVDEIFKNSLCRSDLDRMMHNRRLNRVFFRLYHMHWDANHFEAAWSKLMQQVWPIRFMWRHGPLVSFSQARIHCSSRHNVHGPSWISRYGIKHLGAIAPDHSVRRPDSICRSTPRAASSANQTS